MIHVIGHKLEGWVPAVNQINFWPVPMEDRVAFGDRYWHVPMYQRGFEKDKELLSVCNEIVHVDSLLASPSPLKLKLKIYIGTLGVKHFAY